jgi:hypothetical protein
MTPNLPLWKLPVAELARAFSNDSTLVSMMLIRTSSRGWYCLEAKHPKKAPKDTGKSNPGESEELKESVLLSLTDQNSNRKGHRNLISKYADLGMIHET